MRGTILTGCLYLLQAAQQHQAIVESKRNELLMDPARESVQSEIDFNRMLYERYLTEYLSCRERTPEASK